MIIYSRPKTHRRAAAVSCSDAILPTCLGICAAARLDHYRKLPPPQLRPKSLLSRGRTSVSAANKGQSGISCRAAGTRQSTRR